MGGPDELAQLDEPVSALAIQPNGTLITSHGPRGRLLAWERPGSGQEPRELGHHGDAVIALAAPSDRLLISASTHGQILAWDLTTLTYTAELSHSVTALAAKLSPTNPHRSMVVIGHEAAGWSLWQTPSQGNN